MQWMLFTDLRIPESRSKPMSLMVLIYNLNSNWVLLTPLLDETDKFLLLISVIRATVPKMDLDSSFEQKNEIAKAVEDELEKVVPFVFALC